MRTPSFASAPKAAAICNGVTPISCPMAMEPMELFCQRSTGRSSPAVSPGSSTPVRAPKP